MENGVLSRSSTSSPTIVAKVLYQVSVAASTSYRPAIVVVAMAHVSTHGEHYGKSIVLILSRERQPSGFVLGDKRDM